VGKFVVGDVVVAAFPFSDLSDKKLRPALVAAQAEFDNLILCQITSKAYTSKKAVKISAADFSKGNLPIASYVRPDKLFTAEPVIVERVAGTLEAKSIKNVLQRIRDQFNPAGL
jgi:mRNA interferase MazF